LGKRKKGMKKKKEERGRGGGLTIFPYKFIYLK
jgi:hypothetical protein